MLGGIILIGCQNQQKLSHEEMRSKLRASISLASESEVLMEKIVEDRIPTHFEAGHLGYLKEQGNDLTKSLKDAVPEPKDRDAYQEVVEQLSVLQNGLDSAANHINQPGEIVPIRDQLGAVRDTLQKMELRK